MSIATRTIERDGIMYVVTVVPDENGDPTDADCYTSADLVAWHRGDWSFVGLTVHPVDHPDAQASLWGLEFGEVAGRYVDLDYYIREPYAQTIKDGITTTTTLIDELIAEINHPTTVTLTRDQLQEWAGRELTNDDIRRIADAIPNSSVPEAIATIVANL